MKTLRDLELMLRNYQDGDGEIPDYKWLVSFVMEQQVREKIHLEALKTALEHVDKSYENQSVINDIKYSILYLGNKL